MKKRTSILLAVLLLVGTVLASCTPTVVPTEAPTAEPTAEPTPTADVGELTPAEELTILDGDNLTSFYDAEPVTLAQKSEKTDYMYMYFKEGIVSAVKHDLIVKSGRYGFNYSVDKNTFNSFGLCNNTATQDAEGNATLAVDAMPAASDSITVYKDGEQHQLRTAGGYGKYRLIRSGSTLQSFSVVDQYSLTIPGVNFRTEISASPNMVTVTYDMFLTKTETVKEISGLSFAYNFMLNDLDYTEIKWLNDDPTTGIATVSSADKTKNITFVSPIRGEDGTRDTMTVEKTDAGIHVKVETNGTVTVEGMAESRITTTRTNAVGLIILPNTSDPRAAQHLVDPSIVENAFLKATGIATYTKKCDITFDSMRGIYTVTLRPVATAKDDNLERVKLELANRYGYDMDVLLMFTHKRGASVSAVGCMPMIRDLDGTPTGMSVQISKNWHYDTANPLYQDGQWQEYYAQFTLPARKSVAYEFTCAMKKWGGAESVSHGQLCLIGWSSGTALLWEQAAFGNYTENICYAPGSDAFGQDIRGYMFTNNGGAISGFANNVGGMDFLIYYNGNGQRVSIRDLKIRYLDYGPNLTRVTYDGVTDDKAIKVHYESYLLRSDDFCRIWHKFNYEFLKDVSAKNISFYQYGTEYYNEGYHAEFAYGSASGGLTKLYSTEELEMGKSRTSLNYITNGRFLPLEGENPWLSWLGTLSTLTTSGFGHANKGLVIREYNAVIGGQATATPYLSIRSATGHHTANPSNLMEINGGTNDYKKGDTVSATIEIFVLPQSFSQYVGKNTSDYYINLLKTYAGSWELVNKIAQTGASVAENVTGATVVSSYPAVLKLDEGSAKVTFSLTNGNGYVPVKFTNVPYHNNWSLKKVLADGSVVDIADSQTVHGNDYWQCRYDAETDTYELTYNVPLYEIGGSFIFERTK